MVLLVKSHAGFYVYSSNNLPTTVTLTMDTQPTNLDTITILGVTWTWVTDGTAAAAGEINIGANIADAKLDLCYSYQRNYSTICKRLYRCFTENRRKIKSSVAASAFATNDCVIYRITVNLRF
jgi:hypothetical protein